MGRTRLGVAAVRGIVRRHWHMPLYRTAYLLTFSVATTSGLGMVYWLLAARLYAVDVVGRSAAVIAAMSLLAGLAVFQLDGALIRFLPRAGEGSDRLLWSALLLSGGVATLVGAGFIVGVGYWSSQFDFLSVNPWLAAGFVFSTAAASISVVQDGALVGMRAVGWTPVKASVFAVAKIGFLVAFADLAPDEGILASWMIPLVVVTLVAAWLMLARLLPAHRRATAAESEPADRAKFLRYVGANYAASLFQLATTNGLPIMVLHRAGSTVSAYFYLPWMIATSLRLIATNMSASLVLEGVLDRIRLAAYGRLALRQTARLLVPAVLVLIVVAPNLLRIFGATYATEGAGLLRLLALAALPNVVCVLFIGMARVRDQVAYVAILQAAVAVLSLGLSYALLPTYGLVGLGLAWLATQALLATLVLRTQLWSWLQAGGEAMLPGSSRT